MRHCTRAASAGLRASGALLAAGLAMTLPGNAAARPPGASLPEPRPRLHLALRTGFGLPIGAYADARTVAGFGDEDVNALSDDTHGVVPIWLDAGVRLTPRLMLGGYFVYGIVLPKTAPGSDPLSGGCPEAFECSASGVRVGLQAQYRFRLDHAVQPWAGLGAGYEWVRSELEGQALGLAIDARTRHSGPDLLHLQGGVDFRMGAAAGLGPFASLSLVRYTECSVQLAGADGGCEIEDPSWHAWAVLGVRGALEL